jgi:hypothetical protein
VARTPRPAGDIGWPGVVYLGWLSDNARQGFAQYLRPFSVRTGWLSAPTRSGLRR